AGFVLVPKRSAQIYEMGKIERGSLEVKVTATGTLQPLREVDVGAEVSGRIDTVLVDYNDRVTKGQLLAQINTDQLEAKLAQSKAALGQAVARLADAKAALEDAQLTLNRTQPLTKTGAVSKATLDTNRIAVDRADANVKSAESQVALSQAALNSDQSALDKASIKAPTDGIVLDRLVEPGQTVAATFQTPLLFKIAEDLTHMELDVDIDEADIGSVRSGQAAIFTVDAYPGRPFRARIVSVHNAPKTEQGVVSYQGVLSVDNPDLALKPGMTATAEILVASLRDVLTVPSGALRFVPEGADPTPPKPLADGSGNFSARLWLPAGAAKPRPVDVTAGASDGDRTAIVKGDVHAGEQVIVDTLRKKRPGGFGQSNQ
ncbi:MAG TPA: efflux RND transporter periplasmic adaptor subunit, partial [Alphaproteobacteria bacterium]|nr:efflux RND transporter periplasmic adaptor subunit [Alphaproteobacteria bacterium]